MQLGFVVGPTEVATNAVVFKEIVITGARSLRNFQNKICVILAGLNTA